MWISNIVKGIGSEDPNENVVLFSYASIEKEADCDQRKEYSSFSNNF